jgi:hypothetical protein
MNAQFEGSEASLSPQYRIDGKKASKSHFIDDLLTFSIYAPVKRVMKNSRDS